MKLVLQRFKCFFIINIIIILFITKTTQVYSQHNPSVRFIWTDNALKNSEKKSMYLLFSNNVKKDTIFPSEWIPLENDTITFNLNYYKNPVYLEVAIDTLKKKSNKFNIIPLHTYNLTEYSDSLVVKSKPLVFDNLNPNAKLLYSFLLKLIIEILIAIPIAALFRLPARLLFFVFVANIMSFPLIYVSFIPALYKELVTIILEAFFIFLIGWKRLKFTKALIVSTIINILRFGIYKIAMLIIKIL